MERHRLCKRCCALASKWLKAPAHSKSACLAWVQVRHGAALALREVLRSHATAAAVVAPLAAEPTGPPATQCCQACR